MLELPQGRRICVRLTVRCSRGEFHDDEMQENLVYQGVTLADRQGCAGVVDLTGADVERRLGMTHRDFGLVILGHYQGRPSLRFSQPFSSSRRTQEERSCCSGKKP